MLKASPGAEFDIPFVADWHKIGDYRQQQTDRNTNRENARRYDYDYVLGGQVLIRKDRILYKAESRYKGPWTITQVHTSGPIRIQRGTRSERMKEWTLYKWLLEDDSSLTERIVKYIDQATLSESKVSNLEQHIAQLKVNSQMRATPPNMAY